MPPGVRTTHHVKIGDDYFFVRDGSYRKRPAPSFGSRFTTGDPDYNNLSAWQYWAQTCWVGGFGAEAWKDDAMFDEGVGVDASQHEVMTLSRDLGPAFGTEGIRGTDGWSLDNAETVKIMIVYNGKLYALVTNSNPGKLYRYNDGPPGSWTLIKTFSESVLWMERYNGYLVFGDFGSELNRMDTAEVFTTFAKPSGRTEGVYTMKQYRGQLYCVFGKYIYRLNTDFTWDGSTAFWEGDEINYFNQSEVHLGFLYFASRNGHIVRTDGNNTFDMWQFDPHVVLWGLRSFDGRLFIGAAEEIEGTNSAQAVLYQFSGAAVTELKRWGRVGYDTTPGKLRAFEKSLFFGASNLLGMGSADGFGIARYDAIEDAFHLFASSLDASNFPPGTEGVNNCIDDIMFYKGKLFCTSRRYGSFYTPWTFRDATRFTAAYDTTAAGMTPGSKNGGWYESSDFDAGTPGLLKMWNAITVHVDLPTADTSVFVEVSTDGGQTYAEAGTITKTGAATRYSTTLTLDDGSDDALYATRLKYRLTLRTTDSTRSPQLRGVIVRYLPIPEPNWVWDMTLVLSEKQVLLDTTEESPNNETKMAALRAAFRAQSLLHFIEPGGTEYAADGKPGVRIDVMEELIPHIDHTDKGELEYEVRLSLMEMIDQYESA